MQDLELEPVEVVEEDRVVPRLVRVLLWAALDRDALLSQPIGPLVDERARVSLEGNVMESEPVAVEAAGRVRLRGAQADGGAGAPEVPDGLAPLALDLRQAVPPERPEEVTVERQAALDRGDDEVDMVNAG